MIYENIREGMFLSRPNRFIAEIKLDGVPVRCHVKNTGRCAELLIPGVRIWVQMFPDNPARKTVCDLIAVEKNGMIVNVDSQAPNAAAREWLQEGGWGFAPTLLRPEYTIGDSRYDFYMESDEQRMLLEVKGVTLERDGILYFPDAPTERGVKHLEGLIRHRQEGFRCGVLFVAQMETMRGFAPNDETHRAFGDALRRAKAAGVEIRCVSCNVSPAEMVLSEDVKVLL